MQNTNIKLHRHEVELHLTDSGEGIIDRNARIAFTSGHCHSLALALHNLTTWPMMGFGGPVDSPSHCAVYCPTLDEYIDIEGPGVRMRWPAPWYNGPMFLAVESIPELYGYLPADVKKALPFAQKVLQDMSEAWVSQPVEAGPLVRLF